MLDLSHQCAAVALTLALVCCPPIAAQQMGHPKRAIGDFYVDDFTKAPLQLTKMVSLDASPSRVFQLLERHEEMPKWLPGLSKVMCDRSGSGGSNGVGAVRTCVLADGGSVKENIVAYKPGSLLAYSVESPNAFGLKDHLAVLTTEPQGDGTLLVWRQYFEHPNAEAIATNFSGLMDIGLQKLASGYGGGNIGTALGTKDLQIASRFVVNAPADEVWTIVGRDFGGIDKWASMIMKAGTTTLPGGGTQRTCSTAMGDFRETVIAYDEAERTISYRADHGMPPVVSKAVNTWKVTPTGDGRATVNQDLRIELSEAAPPMAAEDVKKNFGMAVRATSEELAYFAENKSPHPRKAAAMNH